MDKKNTTIGVLLLMAAFASLYFGQRFAPRHAPEPTPTVASPAAAPATGAGAPTTSTPASAAPTLSAGAAFATAASDAANAEVTTLENDFIAVRLTNFGGAIRDVALKKFAAEQGDPTPFVFNELHADPMLAFVDLPGFDRGTAYDLVSHSPTRVVYRTVFDHRIEVTRSYSIVAQPDKSHDPYVVRQVTTLRNVTDQSMPVPRLTMSVGTAAPTNARDNGIRLTTGYSNGKDQSFFARPKLEAGSGFFGLGAHDATPFISSPGPVVWASVSNQFFASILTLDQPAAGLVSRRVKLHPAQPDTTANAYGLTAATQLDVAPLAANGQSSLTGDFYVGPKEYKRLANGDVFKADQDKVMQFGVFKFFSAILLTLMTWIHGWFPGASWAWGWAIVLTTLALKIIFVPFTLAASRSAKRMQKIQPEMQAVREKYKDNPQKMQQATMELFKKHKVNPMGGCLPMLITLPFFWGFFQMLQSAAELRFQPFLWAPDLTEPDTIGHIYGLPINILPILLGAIMVVQMRLTPTPSVDNAQAKMMRLMPYGFALFYYLWPCSLSLYSMINGVFTIGQQLVINRLKDPGPVGPGSAAIATAAAFERPAKNVTPKKKK